MSETFPDMLEAVLTECNLTIYGASQLIGAETDEPLKTISERWNRWTVNEPKTLATLRQDLNALGYEIQVAPIKRR